MSKPTDEDREAARGIGLKQFGDATDAMVQYGAECHAMMRERAESEVAACQALTDKVLAQRDEAQAANRSDFLRIQELKAGLSRAYAKAKELMMTADFNDDDEAFLRETSALLTAHEESR